LLALAQLSCRTALDCCLYPLSDPLITLLTEGFRLNGTHHWRSKCHSSSAAIVIQSRSKVVGSTTCCLSDSRQTQLGVAPLSLITRRARTGRIQCSAQQQRLRLCPKTCACRGRLVTCHVLSSSADGRGQALYELHGELVLRLVLVHLHVTIAQLHLMWQQTGSVSVRTFQLLLLAINATCRQQCRSGTAPASRGLVSRTACRSTVEGSPAVQGTEIVGSGSASLEMAHFRARLLHVPPACTWMYMILSRHPNSRSWSSRASGSIRTAAAPGELS
jgi:hypothetical protein